MTHTNDTICAIATPPGRGGVSIVRVSGPASYALTKQILQHPPIPRHAHYGQFKSADGRVMDVGIALYFPGPDSFTGEDVLELQAHGGPVVVDDILRELLQHGARLARPGEFSERAFLNDKIDLAQAEAIADLIDSASTEAARSALRSLQGEFSRRIHTLVENITGLRVYVEAAIDFPEEEVDFLDSGNVEQRLHTIQQDLLSVQEQARQGSILKEGMKVVIAGEPNAGKSSLLNALSGQDSAIVTDIPGTTRDSLKELITVHGMPLHIVDTAGIRLSDDVVEQEGIKRAWQEIRQADVILLVQDATQNTDTNITGNMSTDTRLLEQFRDELGDLSKVVLIRNKIDLQSEDAGTTKDTDSGLTTIALSAKQLTGLELLRDYLRDLAGLNPSMEGGFTARRRHLDALARAGESLLAAMEQLQVNKAGELVAEDLRKAQDALSEITGEFSSDDLLGKIFSSFCIGK